MTKLSNVVNNEAVKKAVCNKLVKKVNNIDTNGFVLKTKYDTDRSDLERKTNDADKKITDISGLVRKRDYNAKITDIEREIPSISGLGTSAALTAVENKTSNVSNFVQKTDYDAKISESKYFTTADLIKINSRT